MKSIKCVLPWIVVGFIFVVVTFITLGHLGYSGGGSDAKFTLNPFGDFFDAFTCLLHNCESRYSAFRFMIINIIGNIAIFMPLGWALYIALRNNFEQTTTRLIVVTLIGVGVSLFFEISQIWIPGRAVATDDLITNGTGAAIGAWFGWLTMRAWQAVRVWTHAST